MNLPGWRLHELSADLAGHWSVWVSGNWRLTFVFDGEDAISPEMALRLEAWLGAERGGRAELWLGQQMAYDIWLARQGVMPEVRRVAQ